MGHTEGFITFLCTLTKQIKVTTLTDYGEAYLVNSRSDIKNIPTNFCMEFLADLKNEDGTLKDHITDLNDNIMYYGKQGIRCTLPTLFIQLEYKLDDGSAYLLEKEFFLYEEDFKSLKDLENYAEKFSYGFVDLNAEQLDIVNCFHACAMSLSDDYYEDYE
tara:strand:- start:2 stop:484 length:483 start_codon:yes stop_codon:yes gene_type:complete